MKNFSCKIKRILALMLILAMMGSAPALAESYSAAVTAKTLDVYSDADRSKKAGDLDKYTIVTVKAVKGSIAQIKYQGKTLYTDAKDLMAVEDFATKAEVNTTTRVYESADTSSRSAKLKSGTDVYILATSGDWVMIEKGGYVGYTYKGYLDTASSGDNSNPFEEDDNSSLESETFVPESSGSGSVTIETVAAEVSVASLPVYKSASTSSKKLGTLKAGVEVTVYAYNADWAYIELSGNYGFCALSGLRRLSDDEQQDDNSNPFEDVTSATPATITASSVKVYESASTSSKKLGTLKKGAEVNLIKTSSSWAYIELNGNYGYCAASALTETSKLNPNDQQASGEVINGKSPMGSCTVIKPSAKAYGSKYLTGASVSLPMGKTIYFYDYNSTWVQVGIDGKLGYMQRSDLSAESYAELKNEDSGTAVSDMEETLLILGYLDSVPSPNYSANTVAALQRLQAACGMEQTGVADIGTLRVLYSGNAPYSPLKSTTMSKGSKGDNVKRLQNRLMSLGYLSMSNSLDGDYGSTTASAVTLFQTAAGMTTTGTADTSTLSLLYSNNAPKLPSSMKAADANTGSSSNSSGISSNLASTTTQYVSGMSNAQKLEYVIYVAQQQLGKPYVFGATGLKSFDCSGLTQYCFKQIGVSLLRTAYSEGYNEKRTKISSKSSLKRGDLVFFNTVSDGDLSDHTGIYLGNNYFIHASSGAAKVIVSDMSSGYYSRVFSWGRRVLDT